MFFYYYVQNHITTLNEGLSIKEKKNSRTLKTTETLFLYNQPDIYRLYKKSESPESDAQFPPILKSTFAVSLACLCCCLLDSVLIEPAESFSEVPAQ